MAVPLFVRMGSWIEVRSAIESENLLQARTVASGKRLAREVVQRLAELTDDEVALFSEATAVERGQLMWVSACRRYLLVGEFAEEVLREKFLLLAPTVDHSDFDSFMRSKGMWHDEIGRLTESTFRKLRSNLFLMLFEGGLVAKSGQILPTMLSPRVAEVLATTDSNFLRHFPTNFPDHAGADQ